MSNLDHSKTIVIITVLDVPRRLTKSWAPRRLPHLAGAPYYGLVHRCERRILPLRAFLAPNTVDSI